MPIAADLTRLADREYPFALLPFRIAVSLERAAGFPRRGWRRRSARRRALGLPESDDCQIGVAGCPVVLKERCLDGVHLLEGCLAPLFPERRLSGGRGGEEGEDGGDKGSEHDEFPCGERGRRTVARRMALAKGVVEWREPYCRWPLEARDGGPHSRTKPHSRGPEPAPCRVRRSCRAVLGEWGRWTALRVRASPTGTRIGSSGSHLRGRGRDPDPPWGPPAAPAVSGEADARSGEFRPARSSQSGD